jgi:hypothetical protein
MFCASKHDFYLNFVLYFSIPDHLTDWFQDEKSAILSSFSIEEEKHLWYHYDKRFRQGVITSVDETEDVPITSPIVFVLKRTHTNNT